MRIKKYIYAILIIFMVLFVSGCVTNQSYNKTSPLNKIQEIHKPSVIPVSELKLKGKWSGVVNYKQLNWINTNLKYKVIYDFTNMVGYLPEYGCKVKLKIIKKNGNVYQMKEDVIEGNCKSSTDDITSITRVNDNIIEYYYEKGSKNKKGYISIIGNLKLSDSDYKTLLKEKKKKELEQRKKAEQVRNKKELEQRKKAEQVRNKKELEQRKKAEQIRNKKELEQRKKAEQIRNENKVTTKITDKNVEKDFLNLLSE